MNNSSLDILFSRRPVLEYVSPAVCEAVFSSTSFPTLILDAIPRRAGITGLRVGSWGNNGVFELNWDVYPGALCYTVYRLNDANDPLGDYSIVAECITDPIYQPPLWEFPFDPEGACYLVTAITAEGETPIGTPICPFNCLSNAGALPPAEISEPYSYQLIPSSLTPGQIVSWTVLSGSLPPGLTLSNTGLIAGTVPNAPGSVGTFDFEVLIVTNVPDPENPPNVISCSEACQITVPELPIGGLCILTPAVLPQGDVGVPYSVTLVSETIDPPMTWSIISGALPDGLALNSVTGEISGTPTTEELANFTVHKIGTSTDCQKAFSLEVVSQCLTLDSSVDFSPLILGASQGAFGQTSDVTNPDRIFIPSKTITSQGRVSVLDADTQAVLGTLIPAFDAGIFGVSYSPPTETIFVAWRHGLGTSSGWWVYDAVTLGLITTITKPVEISNTVRDSVYDPGTGLVYSYGSSAAGGNPRNGYVVSINPGTNSVVSTVAVNDPGGFTDFGATRSNIAVCEALSRLYIAITNGDGVNTNNRIEIVSLPGLGSAGSISIAPWGQAAFTALIGVAQDTNKLYVMATNIATTEDALIIIDLNTNSIISTTSFGFGGVWSSGQFFPDAGQFVVGYEGGSLNFYYIDTTTDAVICTVPSVSSGAGAPNYFTVDPIRNKVFVQMSEQANLDVYI